MDALQKAIDLFNGQAALADALDVTQPAVSNWLTRGVPLKKAVLIERITNGKIKASDLCPEAFGTKRKRVAA